MKHIEENILAESDLLQRHTEMEVDRERQFTQGKKHPGLYVILNTIDLYMYQPALELTKIPNTRWFRLHSLSVQT